MHDRPSAAELIDAARLFLESELLPTLTEKLYMENTLLRVAGALFCHDAKRAPTRTAEIELNRGMKEKNINIRPDPRLGQPGPLARLQRE